MPARRGGNARPHHRTASTASAKLHTHNAAQPTHTNGQSTTNAVLKRTGSSLVDLQAQQRTTSPLPRHGPALLAAAHRIQSRDTIASKNRMHLVPQKQPQAPFPSKKRQQAHKAGFSIARSDDTDEDDDEWVSSESGAATPLEVEAHDSDERLPDIQKMDIDDTLVNGHPNGLTTPRAEDPPELPRVETARPELVSQATVVPLANSTQTLPPPVSEPPEADAYRHIRSEAPSPTHRPSIKRNRLNRQSSHSDYKVDLGIRPHPLIRGQSFQASLKPKPLAPLTVSFEPAHAEMSSALMSDPGRIGRTSTSPSSMFNSTTLKTPTSAHPDSRPSRKSSISSLHSVATLPVPSSSRFMGLLTKPDRTRTLSTISQSSSSAALQSLNALPTASRPGTPPMVVHFPIDNRHDPPESIHYLLPPLIRAAHLMFVARSSPLADSYERVTRARKGH